MKRFLFLILLIPSLSSTTLSQTPSPSPSPTVTSASSASPQIQAAQNPDPTSIKLSPTAGIEITGYPLWIIWVLLGVAVVGFVVWFFLLRSAAKRDTNRTLIAVSALLGLIVLALMFSVGSWWGRRSARNELQLLIGRHTAVEITPPQATVTSAVPAPEPLPFYLVAMAFMLLVGLEAAMFLYLFLRLRLGPRWYRDSYYWRDRFDRYEDLGSFVRSKFDSMEEQLADLRYRVSRLSSS